MYHPYPYDPRQPQPYCCHPPSYVPSPDECGCEKHGMRLGRAIVAIILFCVVVFFSWRFLVPYLNKYALDVAAGTAKPLPEWVPDNAVPVLFQFVIPCSLVGIFIGALVRLARRI